MVKSKTANKNVTKDALNFLENNVTATIATVFKNLPFAATVYYLVDNDFNFYFLTHKSTDKYLNLIDNDNVALVVSTNSKPISVKARGHAEIMSGREREEIGSRLFSTLEKKGVRFWPIKDLKKFKSEDSKKRSLSEMDIVIRFTPQHLSFMNMDDETYPNSLSDDHFNLMP